MSSNDYSISSGIPDNSEIAKERQATEEVFRNRRIREAEFKKREDDLNANADKILQEQRNNQAWQGVLYGLDDVSIGLLEELKNLNKQLSTIDSQYDPTHQKKINLLAKIDSAILEISKRGRNLGDQTFVKKVYYESSKGDYFLFPDNQGGYGLYAGSIGAFRTTTLSLVTDPKGLPLKTIEPSVINLQPPIPTTQYHNIVIVEPENKPVQQPQYKPHKTLFPKNNISEKEDLSKNPESKLRDNKRNWISGR